jgi:Two component regulator propeller
MASLVLDRTVKPSFTRILFLLFCSLLACSSANAVDPDRRISQYVHTTWRVRDGVFAGVPTAITQTKDGYVWIGTLGGLLRFDGVRVVRWNPPAGEHLPSTAVISLLSVADGSLWIGTASGLAQWKNDRLLNFPETAGRVNSIYEDHRSCLLSDDLVPRALRTCYRHAALGRLSNACSPVSGPREEIPRRSGNHAGPGFCY